MIYPLELHTTTGQLVRPMKYRLAWDLLHEARFAHRTPVCALASPGGLVLCRLEDVEMWEGLLPKKPIRFALMLSRKPYLARRRFHTRIRWDLMQAARFLNAAPTCALAVPGAIVICLWEEHRIWGALVDEFLLRVAARNVPLEVAAVAEESRTQEEWRI